MGNIWASPNQNLFSLDSLPRLSFSYWNEMNTFRRFQLNAENPLVDFAPSSRFGKKEDCRNPDAARIAELFRTS